MAVVSDVEIRLRADIAQLRQDMDRARREVGGAMDNIANMARGAGKALGAMAAVLSVGMFAGFIKEAIDATDAASDISQKTGVAVEQLAGLQLWFQKGGMEAGALDGAMAKLSKNIAEGGADFARLGINTKTATGELRANTAVLADTADKFAAMRDGTAKTALAIQLFGKSGADLIPMLNEGSEGLKSMTEMADKLGLTFDQKVVDQAGEFNDTLSFLGLAAQGVGRQVAAELLPTLQSMAGSFLDFIVKSDLVKKAASGIATAFKVVYTAGVSIVTLFSAVGKVIGGTMAFITNNLTTFFTAIKQGIEGDYAKAWETITAGGRGAGTILTSTFRDVKADLSAAAGTISDVWTGAGGETVAALTKIQKASKYTSEQAVKDAEKQAAAYASLLAAARELAASTAREAAGMAPLNAAQKLNADLTAQLAGGKVKLTATQEAGLRALYATAEANLAAVDAQKTYTDYMKDQVEIQKDLDKSRADTIKSATEEAEKNEQLAKTFGMTAAQIEQVALARLKEQLAQKDSDNLTRAEITQLETLIALKERSAAAVASTEAMEESKQFWTDIEKTAHDTFVSITDGGKGMWKRLKDSGKNMFFEWLYQMTAKKWLINIGASISGTGGVSGIAGAASTAGGLANGASALSGMAGIANFGGSAIAGIGNFIGSSSLSAFGAGFAGNSAGMAMGASEVFASAGMAAEASAASFGAMAAAALPWIAALGAAIVVWKKLDTSGTYHAGGAASASASGVQAISASALNMERIQTNADTQTLVSQLAQGVVGILDTTALAFGKTAGYTAATAFADDTSKDGAWGSLMISKLGQSVVNWQDSRGGGQWAQKTFADGAEGQKQYLAALSGSVREALDSIGLPNWATKMLDEVGQGASIEQLSEVVAQINQTEAALVSLRTQFSAFTSLTDDALMTLTTAAGGIGALSTQVDFFTQNFMTRAEQIAPLQKQVNDQLAALGYAGITTADQFKVAVLGLAQSGALATEAGAKTYAGLLAVAPGFKTVADYLAEIADGSGLDALRTRADDAMSVLSRSVDAQKDVVAKAYDDAMAQLETSLDGVNEAIGRNSALSQALRGAVRGVDSPEQQAASRQVAGAQIATALAIAKASGVLPSADDLRDALSTISLDTGDQFATLADYQRSTARMNAQLEQLGGLTDDQLSTAERQLQAMQEQRDVARAANETELARLDGLLVYGQAQLDAANGISNSVLSVGSAMNEVLFAVRELKAANGGFVGQLTGYAPPLAGPVSSGVPMVASVPQSGTMGGSAAAMQATLEKVEQRMAAMEASSAETARASAQTAQLINNVTAGGNAMLTEIA